MSSPRTLPGTQRDMITARCLYAMAVAIAAAMVFVTDVRGAIIGDQIQAGSPGDPIGRQYKVARNTTATNPLPPTGNWKNILAYASDSNANPKSDTKRITPTPAYQQGQNLVTGKATVTGIKFIVEAQAVATVDTLTATSVTWSADGSWLRITPQLTSKIDEIAVAMYIVRDPLVFDAVEGDIFTVDFTPSHMWSVQFPDPALGLNYGGSSQFTGYAKTNLAGFEDLFDFAIGMDTDNPSQTDVFFQSNPALGLDDTAIAADINARFAYDPTTLTYSFDDTGFEISGSFTIPAGVSSVEIETGGGIRIDALSVPEPATVLLLGVGSLVLLRRRRFG